MLPTSGVCTALMQVAPSLQSPGFPRWRKALGLANATLREYVDSQFNILYAVTPTQVFLINLRNQKQAGY